MLPPPARTDLGHESFGTVAAVANQGPKRGSRSLCTMSASNKTVVGTDKQLVVRLDDNGRVLIGADGRIHDTQEYRIGGEWLLVSCKQVCGCARIVNGCIGQQIDQPSLGRNGCNHGFHLADIRSGQTQNPLAGTIVEPGLLGSTLLESPLLRRVQG